MNDESNGFSGCIIDLIELIGFFVALSWPILLLILNGKR